MLRKITILFLVAGFLGCATAKKPMKMVQHIKGSVFEATDRGYYTTELVMKPKQPLLGKNKAHLIIHDYEARDIPGLKITASISHSEKEIQSKVKPTVKDAGRGLYIIENIDFPEPGMWKMKLEIKGDLYDSVLLSLPEVK
jgi:hypothetical protein